ncbi:unnamed protein product [Eruca vesicaria subsp. sativa]|uniref:Uncharacterized protein n=1 Tax=Eruca vesicaria subsp. sativa TaxID=29727 RepID=A0ABC8KPQ5_ERUVS|nr:unnamed protein product [Eruca vesicaria subsp. sativa]
MDFGGSMNIEHHQDVEHVAQHEDLLGEDLREMEEGSLSRQKDSRHNADGNSTKEKRLNLHRHGSQYGFPRGMPSKKLEFLRRGSLKKHGSSVDLPAMGDTNHHGHKRHTNSRKA